MQPPEKRDEQSASLDSSTGTPGAPLADRMRPRRIEDLVGQEHLTSPESVLIRSLKTGRLFSMILWGPPGSGKTTLARLIASYSRHPFRTLSAVTSGVKEVREIIEEAGRTMQTEGRPTILFVDELHRFNKAQQDGFLPHVETGRVIFIGATTQNPSFEVIPPLLSRARVLILHPLGPRDLETILRRALEDAEAGLAKSGVEVEDEALNLIVNLSHGDARVALNNLEIAADFVLGASEGPAVVDAEVVQKALDRKTLPYDKDGEEHYNLISAFHKSLRGSDAQASLYWLYRMLEAGEDPLFIARRMVRCASEDVGLADPNALRISLAAFEAWEKVGPPEAELALAEAAVYLASAPKSNALYMAEKEVKAEIRDSGPRPVPLHLRNAPTGLMKKAGYSRGYLYPHDHPGAWVRQEYLPDGVARRVFYRPTNRGIEERIKKRMADIQARKEGDSS
ncbi:MAG: replication-associated recombination protein A [Desulfobacteraceae bacterium]